MPGGWTMSMAWMRMPGQPWSAAAASFLGMWSVMMVAMMLPVLLPRLWHYRGVAGGSRTPGAGSKTALAAAGYLGVWTLIGIIIYPIGVALAMLEMRVPALARSVPLAGGVLTLIMGALQFTRWKVRRLSCCQTETVASCGTAPGTCGGLRDGVRMGVQCSQCCGNLMCICLVLGVMDLGVMAAVAAAITIERLATRSHIAARAVGCCVIATGVSAIARASACLV